MTPLDMESLQSKINRIRKNLNELKPFGKLSYKEYRKNPHNGTIAERLLQVSIEAMLDIGSHIIAEEGMGDPLEYRDVFTILAQAKILPPTKKEDFLNMAGLRNRIVHLYETLDHKLIHRFLKNNLGDFEIFIKAVMQYL